MSSIDISDSVWLAVGAVASGGLAIGGAFKWFQSLISNVSTKESAARHALATTTQQAVLALEKRMDRIMDEFAKKSELRETETRIQASLGKVEANVQRLEATCSTMSDKTSEALRVLSEKVGGLTVAVQRSMPPNNQL